MSKKFIADMNNEELETVLMSNERLRDNVLEDMIETEDFYIADMLEYIKDSLSDWSIGAVNHNYIRINDSDKFIEGMYDMQASIPPFTDDEAEELEKAETLRNKYRDTDMSTDEFDELEEELDRAASHIGDMFIKSVDRLYDNCFSRDNQIAYFLDFYATERLDANECYINVDDRTGDTDYILYEVQIKSYK